MNTAEEMESAIASDARRILALTLLPLLDLTSLGEDDTPAQIESLCASALVAPVRPAAVCIYPEHITTALRALLGSAVRIATVVNFPDGSCNIERVVRETRRSIAAGANEIDLVLPRNLDTPADRLAAQRLVGACRESCGSGIILKLILETGLLQTPQRIRAACAAGLAEGVDFLKTSTGKVSINATLEASAIMLEAIAAHGGDCGIKVAGGIRTIAQAEAYLDQATEKFGASWVTPMHFRVGASSLFGELVAAGSPKS